MMLPVYTVVALINIFAKIHNFNINTSKLPYDLRVKRDISEADDIKFDDRQRIVESMDVNIGVDEEGIVKKVDELDKAYEAKEVVLIDDKKPDMVLDNVYYYAPLDTTNIEGVKPKKSLSNTAIMGRLKQSIRKNMKRKLDVESKDDILIPNNRNKIDNKQNDVMKSNDNLVQAKNSKRHNSNEKEELIKRYKRSMDDNNGNNNRNNDYNNGYDTNNNLYNYHVTEKTTLSRAINWFKNLVNSHEKYIILDQPASTDAIAPVNAPYDEYNGEENAKITATSYNNQYATYNAYPNNNYHQQNNGYRYNDNTQASGMNPNISFTNINGHNNVRNGANQYSHQSIITSSGVSTTYYNPYNVTSNGYIYNNVPQNNAYKNVNDNDFYSYNNANATGYLTPGNGTYYTDFNATNSNADYNVTNRGGSVVESCFLCVSFGCPKGTRRMGFACTPING